ncbi:RagB/SusD family nutrient uptake outer membrane protein [Niabella sp. CC-SYL272]|uniref:RagB/SusD family nutrient uptake outer membrane protein n=1 Tax=Niabella agricola TaxID=2891571 RepID=UPI001F2FA967|nr:RagB/SusD family nutrient uptake outer membrane protein [Niabella agricola]MCF3109365.1 RagB/SusD family nutrient uptake outer membrane protein [Niabella agricola]
MQKNQYFTLKLIVLCICALQLAGCKKYLSADEYLHEVDNLNDVWTERSDIRKAWAACFGAMPNYTDMIWSWPFNCNYDEGHAGLDNYPSLIFAQGKFNADNPLFDLWTKYYKSIRVCNVFLENYKKADDKLLVPGETAGYAADARYLRAFYYTQLLELYGPFVIVDKTVDYSNTAALPTKRNTEDDCASFIVAQLDTCIGTLPATEKILGNDMGRPSREAAMALKARVLLWNASPLVNGNPDYTSFVDAGGKPYFPTTADPDKWKQAAAAAKAIIDLNKFELHTVPANGTGYTTVPLGNFSGNDIPWPNGPSGIDPYRSVKGLFAGGKSYWNKEVIWAVNLPSQSTNLSSLGFPRNYNNGEGATYTARLYATQKLVDAFFMNNGATIEEENTHLYNDLGPTATTADGGDQYYIRGNGQEAATPIMTNFKRGDANPKLPVPNRCLNREARFYATIGFIGRGYLQNNGTIYYADYKANALDGYLQSDRPSTRSGYPIVKWVSDEDQKVNGSFDKPYPVFRLAEIYLDYAEALNEYDPANPDIIKYLNLVRFRAGLPGYTLSTQEENRNRIRHERYVEFAFEGKRYFDSRRWKEAAKADRDIWGNSRGMAGQVYGCNYLAQDGRFYDRTVIDGYTFRFKNYFLPIPYQEVANHWGTMTQNPGW